MLRCSKGTEEAVDTPPAAVAHRAEVMARQERPGQRPVRPTALSTGEERKEKHRIRFSR